MNPTFISRPSPAIIVPPQGERQPLEKPPIQSKDAPHRSALSLEVWVTSFLIVSALLVYLSVMIQSLTLFVFGEGACLLLAPVSVWLDRNRIHTWWVNRLKCPECGGQLRSVNGNCPQCGHKRYVA
jgi:hypothetical protein